MARKASKPQRVEPEDESQEVPEPAEQGTEATGSPGKAAVSKTEAAYKALDAGYEKPQQAVDYIRKTFDIEMNPQHFSSIKSNRKKREGEAPKRRGPKRKAAATAEAPRVATPRERTARASSNGANLIDDISAVKSLVEKLGAEQVRKIVGLFE